MCVLHALCADGLRDARRQARGYRQRRLGRGVPGGEARAARGQDEIELALVAQADERRLESRLLVREQELLDVYAAIEKIKQ